MSFIRKNFRKYLKQNCQATASNNIVVEEFSAGKARLLTTLKSNSMGGIKYNCKHPKLLQKLRVYYYITTS